MNATTAPTASSAARDTKTRPAKCDRDRELQAGHFLASVCHKPLFTESQRTSVSTAEQVDYSGTVTLSLTEYRILNPQTAGDPTLTQSRILAQVLERVQRREQRQAEKAQRRRKRAQALKAALLGPWHALQAFAQQLAYGEPDSGLHEMKLALGSSPRRPPRSQESMN